MKKHTLEFDEKEVKILLKALKKVGNEEGAAALAQKISLSVNPTTPPPPPKP